MAAIAHRGLATKALSLLRVPFRTVANQQGLQFEP
ncbi:hypothetical protein CCACVL1_12195 [Corchorus capsularis]|uniref:Uncharacterized protein n=1 Tax=Corchorus capsularis TaxID=210143 RepID=A0A1R3IGT3_COCAP|nr:hypothetical protein CCACVL1_12195 [Corchorus capsularis]